MTNTTDPTPQHHKTFLQLTDPRRTDPVDAESTKRPLTKSERYIVSRVEKGINRRVRRDGTGKQAYEVKVWFGGKALSKTFTGIKDARKWRDEMLGKRATGSIKIAVDRRIKVAQFATVDWDVWLDQQVQFGNLRPSTVSWYRDGARRLVTEIGGIRVAAVGKKELRGMLARCVEAGDSQHTLRHLRASTRSVLALAVDRDILDQDPSEFMVGRNAPRALQQSEPAPRAWSQSEAQTFLQHVRGDRLEALWALLLGSGLRRGEALALRWQDIDLDEGTVTVERSLIQVRGVPMMSVPKTEKSLRTISIAGSAIAALRALKRSQASEKLVSPDWEDKEGLLFTTVNGVRLRPDYPTRRLKKLVNEVGLPWVRLHGMRHTAASQLHDNNVPMATISEWLGHADVGITMRTYIHGSPESGRAAADLLDAALFQ
jgi:integrase